MCGVLAAIGHAARLDDREFEYNPSPIAIFLWLSCASLLGVLLAVPLRRHFVVDEKLPYPDGMAAGETLIVLDPPRHLDKADAAWKHAQRRAPACCSPPSPSRPWCSPSPRART
jgi:uncharacterized oligopeptide transporter (OPT) family protein